MKLRAVIEVLLRDSDKRTTVYFYEHNGEFFRSAYSGLEGASAEDIDGEVARNTVVYESLEDLIRSMEEACEKLGATIESKKLMGDTDED